MVASGDSELRLLPSGGRIESEVRILFRWNDSECFAGTVKCRRRKRGGQSIAQGWWHVFWDDQTKSQVLLDETNSESWRIIPKGYKKGANVSFHSKGGVSHGNHPAQRAGVPVCNEEGGARASSSSEDVSSGIEGQQDERDAHAKGLSWVGAAKSGKRITGHEEVADGREGSPLSLRSEDPSGEVCSSGTGNAFSSVPQEDGSSPDELQCRDRVAIHSAPKESKAPRARKWAAVLLKGCAVGPAEHSPSKRKKIGSEERTGEEGMRYWKTGVAYDDPCVVDQLGSRTGGRRKAKDGLQDCEQKRNVNDRRMQSEDENDIEAHRSVGGKRTEDMKVQEQENEEGMGVAVRRIKRRRATMKAMDYKDMCCSDGEEEETSDEYDVCEDFDSEDDQKAAANEELSMLEKTLPNGAELQRTLPCEGVGTGKPVHDETETVTARGFANENDHGSDAAKIDSPSSGVAARRILPNVLSSNAVPSCNAIETASIFREVACHRVPCSLLRLETAAAAAREHSGLDSSPPPSPIYEKLESLHTASTHILPASPRQAASSECFLSKGQDGSCTVSTQEVTSTLKSALEIATQALLERSQTWVQSSTGMILPPSTSGYVQAQSWAQSMMNSCSTVSQTVGIRGALTHLVPQTAPKPVDASCAQTSEVRRNCRLVDHHAASVMQQISLSHDDQAFSDPVRRRELCDAPTVSLFSTERRRGMVSHRDQDVSSTVDKEYSDGRRVQHISQREVGGYISYASKLMGAENVGTHGVPSRPAQKSAGAVIPGVSSLSTQKHGSEQYVGEKVSPSVRGGERRSVSNLETKEQRLARARLLLQSLDFVLAMAQSTVDVDQGNIASCQEAMGSTHCFESAGFRAAQEVNKTVAGRRHLSSGQSDAQRGALQEMPHEQLSQNQSTKDGCEGESIFESGHASNEAGLHGPMNPNHVSKKDSQWISSDDPQPGFQDKVLCARLSPNQESHSESDGARMARLHDASAEESVQRRRRATSILEQLALCAQKVCSTSAPLGPVELLNPLESYSCQRAQSERGEEASRMLSLGGQKCLDRRPPMSASATWADGRRRSFSSVHCAVQKRNSGNDLFEWPVSGLEGGMQKTSSHVITVGQKRAEGEDALQRIFTISASGLQEVSHAGAMQAKPSAGGLQGSGTWFLVQNSSVVQAPLCRTKSVRRPDEGVGASMSKTVCGKRTSEHGSEGHV